MTTLAYYNIKRIARRKQLMIALYGLPAIAAILRIIFAKSYALLVCAWLCPFVCAILVWAVLQAQISIDRALDLEIGLRSTPASDSSMIWSRVLAGAAIFSGQMIIFGVIIGALIR
ncbi:hypothetical protein LLG46_04970 [bacterium]|nr:hypothetical protein [bacterium]